MSQSQPTANLHKFFATPAIYAPNMDDEDWQDELERMLNRAFLTSDFVAGKISPDDFAEGLFQNGFDPIAAADHWESGLVYL